MAHKAYTSFEMGFSIKGFNANETGDDIYSTFSSKDTWDEDNDGEKMQGTPVQIDTSEERELKVCPDGKLPFGFLYRSVSNELTDKEMMMGLYPVDEVRAGDPVDVVRFRQEGILNTKLFVDGYTPTVGDNIYVSSGKFAGTDPLDGEGIVIGEVIEYDSGDGYARIKLNVQVSNLGDGLKKKEINITAPADDSEQDSGWAIPENSIVKDVKLRVNTAEVTGTTKTLDVGTLSTDSGDADGYLAGVDASSTGIVKGTLDNAGQTLGELLTVDEDGAGALVPEDDVDSGGINLTYTAGSADFAELDADIIVYYYDLS